MSDEAKKQMPKGGRKGGRQFPQINLEKAVEYAKKLVSKTHTGAQPESIILTGVFGSATGAGRIRASAMKQFGLMDGTADAYIASDLAKRLIAAPPDEMRPLSQLAVLKPDVFKTLYETFKGDKVAAAKIRQQASNLEVHPDNLEKCVTLFVESIVFAGLGEMNGDEISLAPPVMEQPEVPSADAAPDEGVGERSGPGGSKESGNAEKRQSVPVKPPLAAGAATEHAPSGRSVIHVNIDLDSSLDTEKLERQLELLRRYGAI
jgi:hypothetical protein